MRPWIQNPWEAGGATHSRPGSSDGPALPTTYTVDAPVFELRLLQELLRPKAHPVVVLGDRHQGYEPVLRTLLCLEGPGRDDLLVPVERGHAVAQNA